MKSIAYHEYGSPDVLHCEELATPVPGDDQVLIRVRAASLNALDLVLLKGKPLFLRLLLGITRPKASHLGRDVAGTVEAVGENVTQFKPGDEVFGTCIGKSLMDKADGSFAEFARTTASALAHKPPTITFEQAAALPIAGLTALQALRDRGGLAPDQSVLIHGAGGGVGSFAVQIAKAMGAFVTAVSSPANFELLRSLGADHLIDYTREEFIRTAFRYDVVLDCFTSQSPMACGRILKPKGRYVLVGGPTGNPLGALFRLLTSAFIAGIASRFTGRTLSIFMAHANTDDLNLLAQWTARGTIHPVIDRTYALQEVPEAFRYFERKQTRGKVVITVA
jgi:NADPH:quinone reductase-like Zn-dependent oxidoreductase